MPPPRGTFGTLVIINPAALQALLEGTNGPVVRDLMRRANRVKSAAQGLVGVYVPPPAGPQRTNRRPGTLRDSIVVRLARGGSWGVSAIVGSNDPIALWHHEGTVPHVIVPRRRRWLVFYWRRVGAVVFAKRVNHPGTQPNRFLTNALPAARR
jgi:hypothetical protein